MNSLMKPIDAHRVTIEELNQKDLDYGFELLTNIYSKQEIIDRLDELFEIKHSIEYLMRHRSLSKYETRKFTNATEELQQLLSVLLKDFKEEIDND